MQTLLIGGGRLGKKLARHFLSQGKVDVIARSQSKRSYFKDQGCGFFSRNISNSRFRFAMGEYDLIILNAAVTVDSRQKSARHRLYVNGTERIIRQLITSGFKGKLLIVGSTSAIPDFSVPNSLEEDAAASLLPVINEKKVLKLEVEHPTPAYLQFKLWEKEKARCQFPLILLMCAGIYSEDSGPGQRLVKGLRSTSTNPMKFINLIHLDDVVNAVILLVSKLKKSDFFLLSDSHPVSLNELYHITAQRKKLPKVDFINREEASGKPYLLGKKVDNSKILKMGLKIRHPSFPDMS
jgi:nucleoside-diphosphate-sugar epimerase